MPVLASLSKRAKVLTITYLTAYEIVRKMQKQKRQSVKYMPFNVLAYIDILYLKVILGYIAS